MDILLWTIVGFLICVGLFLVVMDIFHFPTRNSRKRLRKSIKSRRKSESFMEFLDDTAVLVSKWIPVSEYKKQQLEADIKTAGENITPEVYVARAYVRGSVFIFFAIPFVFIFPLFALVLGIIGVIVINKEMNSLSEELKEKREAIEYELPRFSANIEKTVKHNRDVLTLLNSYISVAGKELASELKITVADMRSGNYEMAVSRLEARIGSTLMSDICRGLISVIRGDDTSAYWATLNIKMTDFARQRMKERANEIPKKTRRLSFVLLSCFMLVYVVVIGMTLVREMGGIFG